MNFFTFKVKILEYFMYRKYWLFRVELDATLWSIEMRRFSWAFVRPHVPTSIHPRTPKEVAIAESSFYLTIKQYTQNIQQLEAGDIPVIDST